MSSHESDCPMWTTKVAVNVTFKLIFLLMKQSACLQHFTTLLVKHEKGNTVCTDTVRELSTNSEKAFHELHAKLEANVEIVKKQSCTKSDEYMFMCIEIYKI